MADKEHAIKKPWDPLDIPDVGDQDQMITYAAVGQSLTEWERMEFSLSFLYALFVTEEIKDQPAIRAFGSITSHEARASMVRAAGKSFYFYAHRSYWGCKIDFTDTEAEFVKMMNIIKEYCSRRNEIAHGIVNYGHAHPGPRKTEWNEAFGKEPHGYALYPNYFSTNKRGNMHKASYTYTSTELNYYAERFRELSKMVSAFANKVRETKKSILAGEVEIAERMRIAAEEKASVSNETDQKN